LKTIEKPDQLMFLLDENIYSLFVFVELMSELAVEGNWITTRKQKYVKAVLWRQLIEIFLINRRSDGLIVDYRVHANKYFLFDESGSILDSRAPLPVSLKGLFLNIPFKHSTLYDLMSSQEGGLSIYASERCLKSSFQWDKNIATNDRHALSESNCYLSLDDLTLNFRGLKAHDPFHFYYNEKIELLLFTQLIFDLLIFEQQENKIKPNFRSGQPYDMAMDAFRCSKQKNDKFVYSLEITPSQLANIKSPVYDSFSDDDVIQDRFNSLHAALEIEKDGLKLLWAGIVR